MVTTAISTLLLEMMHTGASIRGYIWVLFLIYVAVSAIVSLFFSAIQVGLPLYKGGRPLTSLFMTLFCGVTMIIPTMSFIAVKLMGGIGNEKK